MNNSKNPLRTKSIWEWILERSDLVIMGVAAIVIIVWIKYGDTIQSAFVRNFLDAAFVLAVLIAFPAGVHFSLYILYLLSPFRTYDFIRTRKIEVVNNMGDAVLVVEADSEGGWVEIRDNNGRPLIQAVSRAAGGEISIWNHEYTRIIKVGVTEEGGRIDLMNKSGENVVSAVANTQGGIMGVREGYVMKNSISGGGPSVLIGADVAQPYVELRKSANHKVNRVFGNPQLFKIVEEVDNLVSKGYSVANACRQLGISEEVYHVGESMRSDQNKKDPGIFISFEKEPEIIVEHRSGEISIIYPNK